MAFLSCIQLPILFKSSEIVRFEIMIDWFTIIFSHGLKEIAIDQLLDFESTFIVTSRSLLLGL